VIMMSGLGFRLVRVGEVERGLALLRQAAPYRSGFSSWYAFTMCIGSYLTGDIATAAKYDLAAMTDTFPPGFVASALIAAGAGAARRAAGRAAGGLGPRRVGRKTPRHELEKIFHAPWIVERLLQDLAELGLGGATAEIGGSTPALTDREVTR